MIRLVDTSIVVKWFVAEEGQEAAERLIGSPLIAPDLLLAEVSNVIWKKWRRNEIESEQTIIVQTMVSSFVQLVPSLPFAEHALAIALELDHPVYDCYFLAMCDLTQHVMITADMRLINKCHKTRFARLLQGL